MAFFSEEEIENLKIVKSVFHIVGPVDASLKLLAEFDCTPMADFFAGRIKSVNGGNRYKFLPDSPVQAQLTRISNDLTVFQVESENLATAYNGKHGGSSSGAYIIFVLDLGGTQAFALLKFDDEKVLSYSYEEKPGQRPIPKFSEYQQTFVQNREALQKAVLVRLDGQYGDVCVVDRQNPSRPARYFEQYLHVKREHSDADLTELTATVARAVFKKHKAEFSDDVKKNFYTRLYESSQSKAEIKGDAPEQWFAQLVGEAANNPEVIKSLKSEMKRYRIDDESFRLSPGVIAKPAVKRIDTDKGIKLVVPADLGTDVITIDEAEGKIIIHDKFHVSVEN